MVTIALDGIIFNVISVIFGKFHTNASAKAMHNTNRYEREPHI